MARLPTPKTSTPWAARQGHPTNVAVVDSHGIATGAVAAFRLPGDAQFAVTACNAFAALVTALKFAESEIHNPGAARVAGVDIGERISAALKLAEVG